MLNRNIKAVKLTFRQELGCKLSVNTYIVNILLVLIILKANADLIAISYYL